MSSYTADNGHDDNQDARRHHKDSPGLNVTLRMDTCEANDIACVGRNVELQHVTVSWYVRRVFCSQNEVRASSVETHRICGNDEVVSQDGSKNVVWG